MLRTPIVLAPILAASILFVACGDSDSGTPASTTNPTATGLDGSWSHFEGSELRKRFVFQGGTYSYRSYLKKCLISEDSGAYTGSSGDNLLLVPIRSNLRAYSSDAKDSAEACGNAMGTATISGTMPLRREAVGAASFTVVTVKFVFTETGTTSTEVRTVYTKD